MELNALLNGINAGMSQGLQAYNGAREQQMQQQQIQGGLLSKGLIIGDNGQVQAGPQMKLAQQYETDSYDANSDISKHSQALHKGLLKAANPDLDVDSIITPDMSAHEIDNNPTIQKTISGAYGYAGKQSFANALQQRNQIQQQGLLTRQDTQAAHAADTINNDKRIVTLTQQLDQLERGRSILDQPNITNQEFNDYQQEIQNAISGGQAGALGKLERTEYTTVQGELANLKQKLTGKPTDAVPPEIVDRLKNLADRTRDMMAQHRSNRAEMLRRDTAYQHNPAAQATMNQAIQNYKVTPQSPQASPVHGGATTTTPMEDDQAIQWARQNPNDPRAKQIMQLHGGQ